MGPGKLPLLMFGVTIALAAQPAIGPGEIRAQSRPYVPPPPPNTLKSEVNLVEVPVVVRDGKRRAIPGLKAGDFQVFDSGKKQEVTAFSTEVLSAPAGATPAQPADAKPTQAAGSPPAAPAEARPPRFIVLCFDNLSTPFADLRTIKTAAEKFVRTGLSPGDRVAVLTTAWSQPAITFTDEVPKLVDSIEKVTPQQRFSDDNSQCPRITGYQAYLISNHLDNETLEGVAQEDMACKRVNHSQAIQDVTSLANMVHQHSLNNSTNVLYSIGSMVDSLRKLPGRRMLLLASSGFLSGNLEYLLDEMTTKALHAEVVINSLDARGLYTLVPGRPIDAPPARGRSQRTQIAELSIQSRQASSHDDGMAALALGTGGAFFHNSNDLDKGFHELGSTPDVVYILGFSPTDATPDGRFHPLKVKLTAGNHYSLQSRLGYTAPTKNSPVERRQPTKLDAELMAADTLNDVPVTMSLEPGKPENGNPTMNLVTHIDVKTLKFETRADRRTLKLTFLMGLLAPQGGAYITGRQGEIELSLKQETFDGLAGPGFNVTLPLQAPAGAYTLRVVVQEGLEGKITASSLPIELK